MHPPKRIENNVIQGRLRLYWADTAVVLDHVALRETCRCAECQLKRHHGTPINVPVAVRVTTIVPTGYGI